jgi:hypothetical protein
VLGRLVSDGNGRSSGRIIIQDNNTDQSLSTLQAIQYGVMDNSLVSILNKAISDRHENEHGFECEYGRLRYIVFVYSRCNHSQN